MTYTHRKEKDPPPTQTNPHPTTGCVSELPSTGGGAGRPKPQRNSTHPEMLGGGKEGEGGWAANGPQVRLPYQASTPPLQDEMLGPGPGPKPTHATHSRPGHARPHTHIPNTHAHTPPFASTSQMHRADHRHTQSEARTHVPTALTHVHLKAAELGAQGGGGRGPGASPAQRLSPPPVRTRDPHSHPLFDPKSTGPNTVLVRDV